MLRERESEHVPSVQAAPLSCTLSLAVIRSMHKRRETDTDGLMKRRGCFFDGKQIAV